MHAPPPLTGPGGDPHGHQSEGADQADAPCMHLPPSQGPEATRKGISLRGLTKLRAHIMQLCEDGLFDKVCRVITSNNEQ